MTLEYFVMCCTGKGWSVAFNVIDYGNTVLIIINGKGVLSLSMEIWQSQDEKVKKELRRVFERIEHGVS